MVTSTSTADRAPAASTTSLRPSVWNKARAPESARMCATSGAASRSLTWMTGYPPKNAPAYTSSEAIRSSSMAATGVPGASPAPRSALASRALRSSSSP